MRRLGTIAFVVLLAVGTCLSAETSSLSGTPPTELRFSDALIVTAEEFALAKQLKTGADSIKAEAGRQLWESRSRAHAKEILQLVSIVPLPEAFGPLKKTIESDLKPESILRELRGEEFSWGAWLAFLRPHPDLVPELISQLQVRKEGREGLMLALGKSDDNRALEPLIGMLADSDYVTPGFAAMALGYMTQPSIESKLEAALTRTNPWLQLNACDALGKLGTRQSVPALQRLAEKTSRDGVLNIRDAARRAIDQIQSR